MMKRITYYERIKIHNVNQIACGIIEFFRDQILRFSILDLLDEVQLHELTIETESDKVTQGRLSRRKNFGANESLHFSPGFRRLLCELPSCQTVNIVWTYTVGYRNKSAQRRYVAKEAVDTVTEYGPKALFPYLIPEDAAFVQYQCVEFDQTITNYAYYLCELKDKIRFGKQELRQSLAAMAGLMVWNTEHSCLVFEVKQPIYEDQVAELIRICKDLSHRFSHDDELSFSRDRWYFALNHARLSDVSELRYYSRQVKRIHGILRNEIEEGRGTLQADASFFHRSNDVLAMVRIKINHNGRLSIRCIRS